MSTTYPTNRVRPGQQIRVTLDDDRVVDLDVRYVEGRGRTRAFVGTDLTNADQWYTVPVYHVTQIERI